MNYFFITGSSQGLGKSLTELLLEDTNNVVYGFSRNQTIEHSNFAHHSIDLSDLKQVQEYQFPTLKDNDKVVLVNNAGIVGEVGHIGSLDNQKIIDCYNLNLIAPSIITNNFISKYSEVKKLIINISSGAGRTPIDGWNVYCATKAGLDMFSQVINEEATINNDDLSILSLAPGIIDTGMQTTIRSSKKEGFSNIERFIEYKENGDLASPSDTAKQVLRFIKESELQQNVICSVRDLTN
ncbi:MAG: SDR family NAD(P)-dependent oxidoreductase [Vicingaceae bacterium]|nr:SDR family NAD(P)-dependent oxidoreductase [Vicingaceae bacterium]